MPWICANCGESHEENDPPCRKCAHEQFAKLDESQRGPQRLESGETVLYQCSECGRMHQRNSPPCNKCGNMTLQAIVDPDTEAAEFVEERLASPSGTASARDGEPRRITVRSLFSYLFAITMLALAWGYISVVPTSSPVFLTAAIVAAPVSRRWFARRLNVKFSIPALVVTELILLGAAFALLVEW